MRIEPAELAFDGNGTPFSPVFGDVYHSADSGPGQAWHVFLGGNDLPRRWAGARVFTILETGFGLGLNFLTTWQQWRDDPARPERLHFVSIEKHPLDLDALRALHLRYGEFAALAGELQRAWPPLVSGLHRLHFDDERVTLTLAFGDVADVLPRLRMCADAIYLDGFAPDRNADMWSPQVMKRLARLAHSGTTVATWSSASAVREGLEAAGFAVEKRPGFGRKREMSCATFAPRWPRRSAAQAVPFASSRHAIVIGAGLAGAAVSERLARRGWRVDLIEHRPASAISAASRFAGVFHPHVSLDDCVLSRLTRNGFLYGLARWLELERAGLKLAWAQCGVLQLAAHTDQGKWTAVTSAALGFPDNYAQHVGRERAEAFSGATLRSGGWWFPGGGWMRPSSLIAAQLAAAGAYGAERSALTAHFDTAVHAIERGGEGWQALAADGSVIATAPVVVLANASDITRLASVATPLNRVRGQATYLPADRMAAPRAVLTGSGYVLPAADGIVITGSTYDRDDDPEPQVHGHEANLLRLAGLLPDLPDAFDPAKLKGAVGFRCAAPDRMPLVGAVPDIQDAALRAADLRGAHLNDLMRRPGLYCVSGFASRGLVWAALAGEIVASQLEGEPLPIEGDLADALDPARFVLKQVRSGTLRERAE
jgi:tRNA 5-methylaminomethyl-2-thiouridine biosynthesis bifunctional protein